MDGAPGPKVTLQCSALTPEGPIQTVTQFQGGDVVSPLICTFKRRVQDGLGQGSPLTQRLAWRRVAGRLSE
jgi:hypothetical protein